MWDDPLFNADAEALKYHLVTHPDPGQIKQHRRLRLLSLEALYNEIDLLRFKVKKRDEDLHSLAARLQKADEAACRGIWMMHRLIEQADGEEFLDKIEQVHIDARVAKDIDAEFSFAAAVASE